MALLFKRLALVKVAGLTIQAQGRADDQLRVAFENKRTAKETSPRSVVQIYNLGPSNERRIYERGSDILLMAGYPQTLSIVLDGTVYQVYRVRKDLARITVIECSGKAIAIQRLGGITSRSYNGAASVRSIAKDLIADMGMMPGPLDLIPESAQYLIQPPHLGQSAFFESGNSFVCESRLVFIERRSYDTGARSVTIAPTC